MKHCEEFEALLDLYVDGELSTEDMIRVQEHLSSCPACQAYVDDALAIRAAFPDEEDTVVPDGFAESVMAAVARCESVKKPRPTPWKKVLLPLAACLAVVVLALPLRDMLSMGSSKETAASASMEAPAETAMEEPAEAPAASEEALAAGGSVADLTSAETGSSQTYYMAPAPKAGAVEAAESGASAAEDSGAEPTAPQAVLFEDAPTLFAVVTLPPAGQQITLLVDRSPDRVLEDRVEYDLPAEEYETLLSQLDESGLDYTAEEFSGSTGETFLVIIQQETIASDH